MTTPIADWTYRWLDSRGLPTKVDRRGVVYAPVEFAHDERVARELRIGRDTTSGSIMLTVHSRDRITGAHAPRVFAACNRWNSRRRIGRAWVSEGDSTLSILIGATLPVASMTEQTLRLVGDAVVDGAVDFWRWVDLSADW